MANYPFRSIAILIRKLDISDDSIVMDNKIKNLTQDFLAIMLENDYTLKDAMEYFNGEALKDPNFAMNFALLFSSKVFNNLVNVTKFREEIMNLLQNNFCNADEFKSRDLKQFYNSVTLLGEYYCRYRIAEKPVKILGKSLFQLLTKQLQDEMQCCSNDSSHLIDLEFSKLILTQITLNGSLARYTHKDEIDALLYEIRKCLIEVQNLTSHVKALFLMTLDLYYNNFASIGAKLETFYETFLNDTEEKPVDNESTENQTTCEDGEESNGKRPTLFDIVGGPIPHAKQKILKEHIGKPLKASERLKLAQKSDLSHSIDSGEDLVIPIREIAIEDLNKENEDANEKTIIAEALNSKSVKEQIPTERYEDWYEEGQSYAQPLTKLNSSKSCHEINENRHDEEVEHGEDIQFDFKIFNERKSNDFNHPLVNHHHQQGKGTYFQGGSNQNQQNGRKIQGRGVHKNDRNDNNSNGSNNGKHFSYSTNDIQGDLQENKRFNANVRRKPQQNQQQKQRNNKNTSQPPHLQNQQMQSIGHFEPEEHWD